MTYSRDDVWTPNATVFRRARQYIVVGAALIASLALGAAPANADKQPENQPTTRYPVRVTVRELKNRIVEGTVRQHKLYTDQPKAFGADDTAPTPPETLAFALGSCVVSTGRLLALQKKLAVRNLSAVVEGELDFARALGVSNAARAGFGRLTVNVTMDAEIPAKEKAKFLREISARCPMCDNLAHVTPVTVQLASE